MTRGRDANHAYIAIGDHQSSTDMFAHAVSREWADLPAIARRAELTKHYQASYLPANRTQVRVAGSRPIMERIESSRPGSERSLA